MSQLDRSVPQSKVGQAFEGMDKSQEALRLEVGELLDGISVLAARLSDVLEPELAGAACGENDSSKDAAAPKYGVPLADRISDSARLVNQQRERVAEALAQIRDISSRIQL